MVAGLGGKGGPPAMTRRAQTGRGLGAHPMFAYRSHMTNGKTVRLVIAAVCLAPWTAAHATPPYYDPGAYCKQAAQAGGSQQSFRVCYQQEQAAYDRVKIYWNSLAVRPRAFCEGMAESVGSSYQVLETCLQQQGVVAKDKDNLQPAR
jgi:hypothetical protein